MDVDFRPRVLSYVPCDREAEYRFCLDASALFGFVREANGALVSVDAGTNTELLATSDNEQAVEQAQQNGPTRDGPRSAAGVVEFLETPGHTGRLADQRYGGAPKLSRLSHDLANRGTAAVRADAELLERAGGGECRDRTGGSGRRGQLL